ncbi:MAG: SDR family oxidoreductase [Bauldia sp.]
MTQVVVTGAFGFIGRHLARCLADRGYEVIGIGHGGWARDEWRRCGLADWRAADISVEALLASAGRPHAIFHLAGAGSVASSMTNPHTDFLRNVGTTAAVLEFARVADSGTRVVLPSSAAVYGSAERLPIAVGDRLSPTSPYGVHKRMAEELCASYGRHFGLPCAAVRLFSVYGVGARKQLLWDACTKLARGDCQFAGSGAETRDWIHVDDVVELLAVAAEKAAPHCPIVNGGSGVSRSNRQVLFEVAGLIDPQIEPRFDGVTRPGDPADYRADISTTLTWRWAPRRQWQDELAAYVDWFRRGAP